MLELLITLLILFWLLGFAFRVGGDFIHLLLVIILVIVVFRLLGLA